VHQPQPLLLLLDRCFDIFARTPWAAVTAEAAITIATEAAVAVTAEAAAIIALAVAIRFAHHRRWAFLKLVDANAQVSDDVFTDALLPLDLGDRGGRALDVQEHEMCLAILAHAVGEGAYA